MSEMLPKISVIVPIYNSEKYLCKCIDSVLDQTFKDFELLLIDDGSTDLSGEICDEYARKDKRVRSFHKQNGGVASARQMGIDNMLGEYCIQFDSDDWVDRNMLEKMFVLAKESLADIVVCDIILDRGKLKPIISKQGPVPEDSVGAIKDIILNHMGGLPNKLIRACCYRKPCPIAFDIGIVSREDLIVLCKILSFPRKVVYLPEALYHYCINANLNSLTHNIHSLQNDIMVNNVIVTILKGDEYKECREFLESHEAFASLLDGAMGKWEFMRKYTHVKDYDHFAEWSRSRFPHLAAALNGRYYRSRFLLIVPSRIKAILKRFFYNLIS
ncbi:MAG: glycosyltransferase family 2 protein [Bacteroidales bacterium]|nr:glycosyltransferase family 2 protein [Bacteroidales bacterium]MDY6001295.1 glycosyltransferase family 2 protein [Candidatus Cryptobacteroides sp.]